MNLAKELREWNAPPSPLIFAKAFKAFAQHQQVTVGMSRIKRWSHLDFTVAARENNIFALLLVTQSALRR